MALQGDVRPLMRISEASELVSAHLVPDSVSGVATATGASFFLYRFDFSGASSTAKLLASIDGAASSATAWSAFRPKEMLLVTERILLSPGDTIALACRSPWGGSLSLRFRRLQS